MRDLLACALIVGLGVVLLGLGLGDVGFWDPREPAYIAAAREMQAQGTLLVPATQPALAADPWTFWSIIAGSWLFGFSEQGARIAGVVVALAALTGVYYAVARLRGQSAALLSVVVLATSPQFYLLARQVGPDVHVAAGHGLGLLFFAVGYFHDRRRALHYGLGYAALALAALAGGPARGLGPFGLALVTFALIRLDPARARAALGEPGARRRLPLHALGWALVLVLALVPWSAGETVDDRAGRPDPGHAGEELDEPSFYYFQPLIFGLFPWVAFLPLAVPTLVPWRRRDLLERHGFEIFTLAACAAAFVAVSLLDGKWPSYLGPVLVPAAVLVGLVLEHLQRASRSMSRRLTWIGIAALYVSPMLDLVRQDGVELLLESVTTNDSVPEALLPVRPVVRLVLLIGAVLAAGIVVRGPAPLGVLTVLAASLAFYYGHVLLPALDPYKSLRGTCHLWEQQAPDGGALGFVGETAALARPYCGDEVVPLERSTFVTFMNPEARTAAGCIVGRDLVEDLTRLFAARYPGHDLRWIDGGHEWYVLATNGP